MKLVSGQIYELSSSWKTNSLPAFPSVTVLGGVCDIYTSEREDKPKSIADMELRQANVAPDFYYAPFATKWIAFVFAPGVVVTEARLV